MSSCEKTVLSFAVEFRFRLRCAVGTYVLLVVVLIAGLLGQRATGYSQSLIKRPCLEFRLTGVE